MRDTAAAARARERRLFAAYCRARYLARIARTDASRAARTARAEALATHWRAARARVRDHAYADTRNALVNAAARAIEYFDEDELEAFAAATRGRG